MSCYLKANFVSLYDKLILSLEICIIALPFRHFSEASNALEKYLMLANFIWLIINLIFLEYLILTPEVLNID